MDAGRCRSRWQRGRRLLLWKLLDATALGRRLSGVHGDRWNPWLVSVALYVDWHDGAMPHWIPKHGDLRARAVCGDSVSIREASEPSVRYGVTACLWPRSAKPEAGVARMHRSASESVVACITPTPTRGSKRAMGSRAICFVPAHSPENLQHERGLTRHAPRLGSRCLHMQRCFCQADP